MHRQGKTPRVEVRASPGTNRYTRPTQPTRSFSHALPPQQGEAGAGAADGVQPRLLKQTFSSLSALNRKAIINNITLSVHKPRAVDLTTFKGNLSRFGLLFPASHPNSSHGNLMLDQQQVHEEQMSHQGVFNYGPTGALIKKNIQSEWQRFFSQAQPSSFMVDTPIRPHSLLTSVDEISRENVQFIVACKACGYKTTMEEAVASHNKRIQEAENERQNPTTSQDDKSSKQQQHHPSLKQPIQMPIISQYPSSEDWIRVLHVAWGHVKDKMCCVKCSSRSGYGTIEYHNMAIPTYNEDHDVDGFFRTTTLHSALENYDIPRLTLNAQLPYSIVQTGKVFQDRHFKVATPFQASEMDVLSMTTLVEPRQVQTTLQRMTGNIQSFLHDVLRLDYVNNVLPFSDIHSFIESAGLSQQPVGADPHQQTSVKQTHPHPSSTSASNASPNTDSESAAVVDKKLEPLFLNAFGLDPGDGVERLRESDNEGESPNTPPTGTQSKSTLNPSQPGRDHTLQKILTNNFTDFKRLVAQLIPTNVDSSKQVLDMTSQLIPHLARSQVSPLHSIAIRGRSGTGYGDIYNIDVYDKRLFSYHYGNLQLTFRSELPESSSARNGEASSPRSLSSSAGDEPLGDGHDHKHKSQQADAHSDRLVHSFDDIFDEFDRPDVDDVNDQHGAADATEDPMQDDEHFKWSTKPPVTYQSQPSGGQVVATPAIVHSSTSLDRLTQISLYAHMKKQTFEVDYGSVQRLEGLLPLASSQGPSSPSFGKEPRQGAGVYTRYYLDLPFDLAPFHVSLKADPTLLRVGPEDRSYYIDPCQDLYNRLSHVCRVLWVPTSTFSRRSADEAGIPYVVEVHNHDQLLVRDRNTMMYKVMSSDEIITKLSHKQSLFDFADFALADTLSNIHHRRRPAVSSTHQEQKHGSSDAHDAAFSPEPRATTNSPTGDDNDAESVALSRIIRQQQQQQQQSRQRSPLDIDRVLNAPEKIDPHGIFNHLLQEPRAMKRRRQRYEAFKKSEDQHRAYQAANHVANRDAKPSGSNTKPHNAYNTDANITKH